LSAATEPRVPTLVLVLAESLDLGARHEVGTIARHSIEAAKPSRHPRTITISNRKAQSLTAPSWLVLHRRNARFRYSLRRARTAAIWTAVERGFSAVVAEHIGLICLGHGDAVEVAARRCMGCAPVCAQLLVGPASESVSGVLGYFLSDLGDQAGEAADV
jgi:hypothetical protein